MNFWVQKPLPDNPSLPQYSRLLGLAGVNLPEVGELSYLSYQVVYQNKVNGKIEIIKRAPIYQVPRVLPGVNINIKLVQLTNDYITQYAEDIATL